MKFNLASQVSGVDNLSKERPFLFAPSQGTIKAQSFYEVKITFQPDHQSNDYFDILLIDIPNQINAKSIYLRGQAYDRQFFAREHRPFEWKPTESLKRKYEEPLKMLLPPGGASPASGQADRPRIELEFARDEDVEFITDDEFEKAKNRERSILIGNCRLMDNKMEKPGNYEINAPPDAVKYFECDQPKGTVQGGQEQVIKFKFNPPQVDELLKDIGALKGIGQWVENVWELKLQGGFVEPGQPDPLVVDVMLRAYVEQI